MRLAASIAVVLLLLLNGCGDKGEGTRGQTSGTPSAAIDGLTVGPPLSVAVRKGNLKAVDSLLAAGADVNAPDILGRTALHVAAFYNRKQIAALLLAHGADVKASDSEGLTPLHAAVLAANADIATLLLDKGADVNAVTDTGKTPLHLAAAIGCYRLTKLLIPRGADVNRKDKSGRTARFYAVRNGHAETAALLKKNGGK
ncbi:phosphocholine transferase AnkX [mine drainage metagenome]|uniref:Phosphocholine transferase AnkX n=1 Tax=mine drainage metagenome TaxID=410659 RepID=A0A1J5RSY6_9ZZZZ